MQEGPGMKTNRSKTAVKFGALEVVLCVREQEVTACYQIKNVAMVIFFFRFGKLYTSLHSVSALFLSSICLDDVCFIFPIVMQNPIIEILKF